MRKNLSFRIVGWILLLALTACLAEEKGMEQPLRVTFAFSGDGLPPDTRSVLSPSVENRITSVLLAVYREGRLDRVRSFGGTDALSLSFPDAAARTVYAFVNMPGLQETSFPLRESGIGAVVWRLTSYAAMERNGLPMSGSARFAPSDGRCTVEVRRLVSRLSFRLGEEYKTFFAAADRLQPYSQDPSRLLGNLTYSLKNINGTLRPFGVSAAGPDDLLSDREFQLTADGTAVLYVPENAQGDLPAAALPAGKTFSELRDLLGRERMPCASYVETAFRQDPGIYGVGGSLTYRFFLGDGRPENFTVGRNRNYPVRFGPVYGTVMDCYDAGAWNWKVESPDWRDSRYLRLDRDAYRVRRTGTLELGVAYGYEDRDRPENGDTGDLSAVSCDWRAYVKEAGRPDADLVHCAACPAFRKVSYDAARGLLSLQMTASVPAGKRYEFVLRTADRRHEARASLLVLSEETVEPEWTFRPGYIAQKPAFHLVRSGTRMDVTSVRVLEGGDRISCAIQDGRCVVSLLRAGPVRLEAFSGDTHMVDIAFDVKTPLLGAVKETLLLRLDASEPELQNQYFYRMRPDDGGHMLVPVHSDVPTGSYMFAPDLYETLLKPVLSVGSGPLTPYVAVAGTFGYVASYAPEGMAAHFGKKYAGAFVLQAAGCADVEPLPLPALLEHPFPGFSAGTDLGAVRNCAVLGICPPGVTADARSVVFTGKRVGFAGGPVLKPAVNRSSVSFRSTGGIGYELDAAGRLVLYPVSASGPAVGRLTLAAVIRNVRTGRETDVPVGRLDCYLFTQVGAVLKNTRLSSQQGATFREADIVTDLWGGDKIPAFQSLRRVLQSAAVVQTAFAQHNFQPYVADGTDSWIRFREQDASTQAAFTNRPLMSRWTEAQGSGSKYKLGARTYSVRLNARLTAAQEYTRTALLQNRSTPTYMTCDLTGVRDLVPSDLGYHYAYGTERDAAGRSYYVCAGGTEVSFFIRAEEWTQP